MNERLQFMHASELVELAALLASNAGPFIETSDCAESGSVEQYWSRSRCRMDNWTVAIKHFQETAGELPAAEEAASWAKVKPTLEEILTGDVLVRVWTALAVAHDDHRGGRYLEPIARSVLVGHLEARNRALNLMVYGKGLALEHAVALNKLRRQAERWSDLLLARVHVFSPVDELAFDAARVQEFSDELKEEAPASLAWELTLASLRATFNAQLSSPSPNAGINRQIAGSLLACLDGALFDSTGMPKSLWLARLNHTADDTQGMIDQLIKLDAPLSRITREIRPPFA